MNFLRALRSLQYGTITISRTIPNLNSTMTREPRSICCVHCATVTRRSDNSGEPGA
jgi:hypothetical protein